MSTYEDDHNITPRRHSHAPRNHQTLGSIIDGFLQGNSSNDRETLTHALQILNAEEGSALALDLLQSVGGEEQLLNPDQPKGVDNEFLDSLERVEMKDLPDKDADCPICTNRFVDDKYPLVVKLPCGVQQSNRTKDHIFDLECVGPWLKVNSTCPICRFDLLSVTKKRKEKLEEELRAAKENDSEEEEEDWDAYG